MSKRTFIFVSILISTFFYKNPSLINNHSLFLSNPSNFFKILSERQISPVNEIKTQIKAKIVHEGLKSKITELSEKIVTPDVDQQSEPCWNKLLKSRKELCGEHCLKYHLPQYSEAARFLNDGWDDQDGNISDNQRTVLGKFYYALAEADLLWGHGLPTNYDHAIELLNEVHRLDPLNSAPFLFMAMIEQKRNNKKEAKRILEYAAMTTTRFDSYLGTLASELYKNVVLDETDFAEAAYLMSRISIPDYKSLGFFLLKYDSLKEKFGLQMIKGGLDLEGAYENVKWFLGEYSTGYDLLVANGHHDIPLPMELFQKGRSIKPFLFDFLENCQKVPSSFWAIL